MSTKTTFKRIALVTVAALGFGVMSVAPSSAANGQADTLSAASATSSMTIGTAATVVVTSSFVGDANDTSSATVSLVSGPATNGVLPTIAMGTTGNTNLKSTSAVAGRTANFIADQNGLVVGTATASLNPTVAGTYVVRITPHTGAAAAALTWIVTVSAPDTTVNVAKTTSFINAGETDTAVADATVVVAKALSNTSAATIKVTPKNAADAALSGVTLSATISGPGTIAIGTLSAVNALNTSSARAITGASGEYYVAVFADGTSGVGTVTISSGTTELSKETVTFYGAAATITPTVVKSILSIGANNAGAITAIVKDAAGVPVFGQAVYAVSDTAATILDTPTTCGTSDATGLVTCDLNGLAAGTAKITLINASTVAAATISTVAGTMRVSDGTVTKVSYSFDKTTYAPGETAKITATVSNAAGLMPTGTYTVLTGALGSNYSIGSLPATTPATVIVPAGNTGAASYTVTVSTGISGTLTLSGTAATGVTATFGSAEVVNAALVAAQEATDAANEATDAGNNAKDAADQAIEAADAATIAAQDAAAAAEAAGEMAVAAAEAAGAIAQDALDAANAATDAALSAAEAADAATAAANDAKESADAATAAVAELSAKVAALMAALNAKVTTLSNLVAKIAKKVKA